MQDCSEASDEDGQSTHDDVVKLRHYSEDDQRTIMEQRSEHVDADHRRSIFASPESEPPCVMLQDFKHDDDQSSLERKRRFCGVLESAKDDSDLSVPVTERRRKWNVVASSAFEHAVKQSPKTSFWDFVDKCGKSEHDCHPDDRVSGSDCRNVSQENIENDVLIADKRKDVVVFRCGAPETKEPQSDRQRLACAICGQQETIITCSECALRVCDWCMNPSGKCIECQNPWGNLFMHRRRGHGRGH